MRYITRRFFLAGAFTAMVRRSPGGDAPRAGLRVMTYNILGGRNTDGSRDLDRVAGVIRAANPDLVALQEVDRNTRRCGRVDIPAELARRTGLHAAFAAAMPYDGGDYGEAVLSRFPIRKETRHALPHRPASEPRAALTVDVAWPGPDDRLSFTATHLDHLADGADRMAQAEKLHALLDGRGPALLAGDFNDGPDSPAMKILRQDWRLAWPHERPALTYPSKEPRISIDHILFRPGNAWIIRRARAGNELRPDDPAWPGLLQLASDHLPLVVELESR